MKIPFRKEKKLSLPFIAFLQALGLIVYCSLVGLVFWQGNNWTVGTNYTFLGPALVFILFVASALISALIILGYPFILFWEKKKTAEALRLIIYTIAWLVLFILFVITLFIVA